METTGLWELGFSFSITFPVRIPFPNSREKIFFFPQTQKLDSKIPIESIHYYRVRFSPLNPYIFMYICIYIDFEIVDFSSSCSRNCLQRSNRSNQMAWNVFKFCTALRALGSVMIVFVLGIVSLSYYVVVVAHFGPALFLGGLHSLLSLLVLLLFHSLLVMLLWSYFSVLVTDPGGVPPNWRPATDEERGEADSLVESECNGTGLGSNRLDDPIPDHQRVRFCRKCNQFKPPRCHHCSVCGRCILKMDHHCVWVVNCVGALNYKYFLLFLFYTFLETTAVTLSLLPYFIAFFTDGEITGTPGTLAATFITFILNFAFSLSVMGFLIMHLSLVGGNTTTIEAYEKRRTSKWHYDLGRRKNFEQVFGTDKKYWLIPAYSEEDLRRIPALQGLEYPTEPELNALQPL